MSESVKDLIEIPSSFFKESTHFINRCVKPNKEEFIQLCRAISIGFCVMGFIGYVVKLIHIPMFVTAANQLASRLFSSLFSPAFACMGADRPLFSLPGVFVGPFRSLRPTATTFSSAAHRVEWADFFDALYTGLSLNHRSRKRDPSGGDGTAAGN
ncbi:Sec61p translocation complex subunit [Apiotrichum porosum]|uniref:Sec61p translocation complex subunit n=1 Tax=Apiotrichum porosum TaxID=105984 RepID=A0A427XVB8_9TREE|nr:Sec61p translocation complex subunit [Apiotrichum porosum]RSH82747.1 Sec61p translocation complex subunit [Apiotrichum porosum]